MVYCVKSIVTERTWKKLWNEHNGKFNDNALNCNEVASEWNAHKFPKTISTS